MFEKFIEFHKKGKHHFHRDDDTDSLRSSLRSSLSSNSNSTEGYGSFLIFVICIMFSLIGGLVGFRWCKNTLITNK